MHFRSNETERVLGDLQRAWKGVAPNPLFVDPGPNRKPADDAKMEKRQPGRLPAVDPQDGDEPRIARTTND